MVIGGDSRATRASVKGFRSRPEWSCSSSSKDFAARFATRRFIYRPASRLHAVYRAEGLRHDTTCFVNATRRPIQCHLTERKASSDTDSKCMDVYMEPHVSCMPLSTDISMAKLNFQPVNT